MPLLALVFVACGGGSQFEVGGDSSSEEMIQATPAAAVGSNEFAEPEAYDAGSDSESDEASDGSRTNTIASSINFDRFIIRSSQLTLTVEDVGDATVWVRDLATRRQGFVFSSSSYTEEMHQYAQVTIRVPAEQFDGTLSELQSAPFVVQVEREESSSQDVSAEYVDNESRLTALEETERRYLTLLSEADTIDEILRVEYELNTIRTEIESIQGRQNYLDEMTAYSTISVTLQPEAGLASLPDGDNTGFFGTIFGDAWDTSEGVLQAVLTVSLTAGIVGLVLLPFAVAGYLLFRLARSRFRRPASPEPDPQTTQ